MLIKLLDREAKVFKSFDVPMERVVNQRVVTIGQSGHYPGHPREKGSKIRTFEQDSEHPHLYLEVKG